MLTNYMFKDNEQTGKNNQYLNSFNPCTISIWQQRAMHNYHNTQTFLLPDNCRHFADLIFFEMTVTGMLNNIMQDSY